MPTDFTLLTSTMVIGLIQKEGRVTGVRAKGETGTESDYQAGAVVVCTGGFGNNPELIKRNLPEAAGIITHTPAYAKGEGLTMCEKVGAALVNMDHTFATGPYSGGVPSPDKPTRAIAHVNLNKYPGAIWVNMEGRRMVNEDCGGYQPKAREALAKAPGLVLNVILDRKIKEENPPILEGIFVVPQRSWEWFEEKANEGVIIKKADTIQELGQKLGMEPSNLMDTVDKWNHCVEAGQDTDFDRKDLNFKIEIPPFYGIRMSTIVIASSGGPATNVRQQVLDNGGRVIPGLYAAGEVAGYQGHGSGCLHSGNIVFGRQAGEMAAQYALYLRR